jgi:hypothetical protein
MPIPDVLPLDLATLHERVSVPVQRYVERLAVEDVIAAVQRALELDPQLVDDVRRVVDELLEEAEVPAWRARRSVATLPGL